MLELRKELVALVEWEEADFESPTQTEIDAVAHRIIPHGRTAPADARDCGAKLGLCIVAARSAHQEESS